MAANYVLLEKITVGAATASSVTFSGIPQTGYTDLKVVISSGQSAANGSSGYYYDVTFNGTSANRSGRYLIGQNGISAVSGVYTLWGVSNPNDFTANTFSNGELYIPDYTSSNFKSASLDSVNENNASTNRLNLSAGLWSDTAAINSITFTPAGGNFIQHSTFYLYGIAKLGTTPAIVPYATGGDTIMTDGTYWYHTFLSSGTFTPAKAITCDYLVVAGGGGGGTTSAAASGGGGGGAGGYRTSIGGSPLSLGTSAVTVTVGAGGAGQSSINKGGTGSDSVFSTITSSGGGGGASIGGSSYGYPVGGENGVAGGSGGGASFNFTTSVAGTGGAGNTPSTSPSQGNTGGVGNGSGPNYGAGGGGGSGGNGGNGTTTVGGAGGLGTANSISGSSVTYAGGGGGASHNGGTGGTGGTNAGNGGTGLSNNSTAGTANRGGGGGGNNQGQTSSAGGSGIVIIRYAV